MPKKVLFQTNDYESTLPMSDKLRKAGAIRGREEILSCSMVKNKAHDWEGSVSCMKNVTSDAAKKNVWYPRLRELTSMT